MSKRETIFRLNNFFSLFFSEVKVSLSADFLCIQGVPLSSIGEAEGNVSLSGTEQRNMLMNKLNRAPSTRVLCLRNMLKASELDGDVEAEVTEECESYGTVNKVVIYQERQSADPGAETIVKIFVQFGTPHEVNYYSKRSFLFDLFFKH